MLILLCSIGFCGHAKDKLSSEGAIERCEDLERSNEATIKSLKKEYKAKVTMERWTDGNTYYIIRNGKKFARADLNGNLITYNNGGGKPKAFFNECKPYSSDPGETVMLVYDADLPTANGFFSGWTLAFGGSYVLPHYKFERLGKKFQWEGMTLYEIYSSGRDLYKADGSKLFPFSIVDIAYLEPGATYSTKDRRKLKYRFKAVGEAPYIHAVMSKGGDDRHNGTYYNGKFQNYSGYALPGYAMSAEKGGSFEVTTLPHFNPDGKELQRDSVVQIDYAGRLNTYHFILGDEEAPDSITRAWFVSNTYYMIYERLHADGSRRRGLIDMNERKVIAPEFEDIYVSDYDQIMVKENKLATFTPYDSTQVYVHTPSAQEPKLDNIITMIKNGSEVYNADTLIYLTPLLVENMYTDLNLASLLYDDKVAKIDPSRDSGHVLKYTQKTVDNGKRTERHINSEETINYYNELVSNLANGNDSINHPQILLTELSDKLIALETIIDEYTLQRNAEAAQARAEREARAERIRKARERIARIDAFQAQLKECQAIVNEAQTRIAAKQAAKRGGSSAVITSGTSSGGDISSGSEDTSGRIAFLKGQIAEWKNKLAKAEKSYRDVMAGGEDSWEKKRVIDSKRNSVDECLKMIKEYESELNSLLKR